MGASQSARRAEKTREKKANGGLTTRTEGNDSRLRHCCCVKLPPRSSDSLQANGAADVYEREQPEETKAIIPPATRRSSGQPESAAQTRESSIGSPSIGAAVVSVGWKHDSVKRDRLGPTPSTDSAAAFSTSDDSLVEERRHFDGYHLSEQSHEVLQQIIRCFPFPSPRSSPRPPAKKSLTRTISNEPTSLRSPHNTTEPPQIPTDFSVSSNGPSNWQMKKKRFGHLLNRIRSHEAPEGGVGLGTSASATTLCTDEKEGRGRGALGRLCQITVDTMAVTSLPLDCWLKDRLKHWVQLSGHEGTIIPATNHTLWKKQPAGNTNEARAYSEIMADEALRGLTPKYFREIEHNGDSFIEIQDLLSQFVKPECRAVMDIKLGFRTFLESEVSNCSKRKDLFKKMMEIDPNEPTEEERKDEAITKLRYMQFRERESSTATLGFRIEAAQSPGGKLRKSFQKVRTSDQVLETLNCFFGARSTQIKKQLAARLREMRLGIEMSEFFRTHEVVGSSILIVFDDVRTNAWMIDFAKSIRVPEGLRLTHRRPWEVGNHEEGYLMGIDNLIEILER